ncbi:MAG: SRPBCC family protein [Bacteroidia bacterium]|nr:SRPBCC family protein [Bacteroidia bacterium]
MVRVTTHITISKPIDMVVGFASNPENAMRWYKNIKSVEFKTEKPLRVGSQIAFIAHFMNRKLYYVYQVMEMNSDRFVMQTSDGPFPMKTTYEWEKLSESLTRMTLTNEGQPSGFSRFFTPFMSMMMRRANQKDLQQLKAVLESRPDTP